MSLCLKKLLVYKMFLHFVKILKTNKIKGIIIMIPFILLVPIHFLQYVPFVLTAIPAPYADYTVGKNAVVLNKFIYGGRGR